MKTIIVAARVGAEPGRHDSRAAADGSEPERATGEGDGPARWRIRGRAASEAANRGQDRQGTALLGGGRLGEHSDARRRQPDRPENDRPRLSRQRRAHATRGRPALGGTGCFDHGFSSRHRLHTRSREPHRTGNAGQGLRAHTARRAKVRMDRGGRGRSALRGGSCTAAAATASAASAAWQPPVVGAAADVVARSRWQKVCRIG